MPGEKIQRSRAAGRTQAPETNNTAMKKLLYQMRTSRRGGLKGLLGFADSDKFNEVMNATQALVELAEKPVGKNRKEAQANATRMLVAHARLLQACDVYLARKAHTDKGKIRQNIVSQVRALARIDVEGARTAMDQVGTMTDDEIRDATWPKIMGRSRQYEVQLDVNFDQLETTGGQASKVYKVPGVEGLSFFKEEENYHREYDDEFRERNRVGREWVKKQAETASLSPEARQLLAERMHYDLTNIHSIDSDWQKFIGDTPASVIKELRDFKAAHERGKTTAEKQAGIGFEVITAEDRLNLRLDENKSANISRRNVATSRIADLLGIGDIVARSRTARITDKSGNVMMGNLMEGAEGVSASQAAIRRIDKKAIAYAQQTGNYAVRSHDIRKYGKEGDFVQPGMQKGLTSLQVLDALCGQQDRHLGNYFVQMDDQGNATGIKGIDNDFAFGRTELDPAAKGSKRSEEQKLRDVVQKGKWILPHVDKQLAMNVLALKDATVKYALMDLITPEEIDWFLRRLHDMQTALRKEMADKNSKVFVEKDSDWNEETFEDMMAMNEIDRMEQLKLSFDDPESTNVNLAAPYITQINPRRGFSNDDVSAEAKKIIAEMEAKHKAEQAAQAGA